jgi:hypothetical protein
MVLTYDAYSETLESEKQKEDRVSILEKQMQSLVSTLFKLTEQGQVNAVAQTLYSSGILKEGAGVTEKRCSYIYPALILLYNMK